MYFVYVHTFPNGKRYVGITTLMPELRWGSNGCNYKNPYMRNAIKKYGWNNVKHEIVAENLSMEDAEQMEIDLIKKYNSANKMYGYNISSGGIICKNISEQTKEKLRIANIGKKMPDETKNKISIASKGRHCSDIVKQHMSDAQKINFRKGNNAMHSPEARAKVAKKLKGRKPSVYAMQKASEAKYHSVQDMQTGIVYPSIKDATQKTGLNRSTIIRHCKGLLKNQKWKYVK